MKLLYLPNESTLGDQIGPRAAFESLLKQRKLDALEIFSFRVEAKALQKPVSVWEEVLQRSKKLEPDIILFQHISDFPLPSSVVPSLKSLPNRPTVCYHEGDLYGRLFKPFSPSMKTMASQADLAFLVGSGKYATRFLKYGTKQVGYSPSCVDTVRFGAEWTPTLEREFDVIVIGNRIVSRLAPLNWTRWGRMPGAFERDEMVRKLGRVFGERFALYGQGWDGFTGARGPIPFSEQEKATRNAWVAVSWDHFHKIPYFFSNRLAISLISGVANLTNYHPGYEDIFTNNEQLVWAHSIEDMIEKAKELLSRGEEELIKLGQRGRSFAMENLTTEVVYSSIIEHAAKYRVRNDFDGLA